MNIPKNLSKTLTIAAFGGMLFCCLVVTESRAQSEKERTDREQIKSVDNSFVEGEKQETHGRFYEKKPSDGAPYAENVIRDSSGYRVDEQKEVREEGKSTLSFNIFLYVLDRFKEN